MLLTGSSFTVFPFLFFQNPCLPSSRISSFPPTVASFCFPHSFWNLVHKGTGWPRESHRLLKAQTMEVTALRGSGFLTEGSKRGASKGGQPALPPLGKVAQALFTPRGEKRCCFAPPFKGRFGPWRGATHTPPLAGIFRSFLGGKKSYSGGTLRETSQLGREGEWTNPVHDCSSQAPGGERSGTVALWQSPAPAVFCWLPVSFSIRTGAHPRETAPTRSRVRGSHVEVAPPAAENGRPRIPKTSSSSQNREGGCGQRGPFLLRGSPPLQQGWRRSIPPDVGYAAGRG